MISEQNDVNVLEAIYTLLQKTSLNPVLKTKLTNRAKQAEEDILSDRVYTKDDVVQRTNQHVYVTDVFDTRQDPAKMKG